MKPLWNPLGLAHGLGSGSPWGMRNSAAFWKKIRYVAFFGLFACGVSAQGPVGSLLVVDIENLTLYARDVADYTLLGAKPGPTADVVPKNFGQNLVIGDIVAVNGKRVKGTLVVVNNQLTMQPGAPPGTAIADVRRNNWDELYFEILNEDGTLIGSIRVSGVSSFGGVPSPPPGQTRQIMAGSYVVVGGNGAFLGAHGYMGAMSGSAGPPIAVRTTSMAEDPANRRTLGGGTLRRGIYILPMLQPEVVAVAAGPAIVHASDYSLVTAQKPAKAGEILTLFASGLGPTRPGVEPGAPFPANVVQVCNSPIEVLVNGKSGDVLYAGGYPGAVDRYQVNFRVPDGTASGPASLQLSSAWILGPDVKVPIQ